MENNKNQVNSKFIPGSDILQIVRELAYPRRCGSDGEKHVQKYLLERFKSITEKSKNKTKIIQQAFSFSSDTARIMFGAGAIILTTLLLLNSILLIFFNLAIWRNILFITSGGILLFLLLGSRWNKLFEAITRRKGEKMIETANIVARVGQEFKKNVIFTAHYDSKSGTAPMLYRFLLGGFAYATGIIIAIYTAGVSGYFIIYPDLDVFRQLAIMKLNMIAMLLSLLVMAILIYFYFQEVKNESPGALDNASGVAVLLNLFENFSINPPDNVNLWFVATSAEEEGLVGIVRVLDEYGKNLDKKNTFFINLDGVGGDGQLKMIDAGILPFNFGGTLRNILRKAAKANNIDLRWHWLLPGIGFDSIPPQKWGFMAINLSCCSTDKVLWSVHTKDDTVDHISPSSLDKTFRLCREAVRIVGNLNANQA